MANKPRKKPGPKKGEGGRPPRVLTKAERRSIEKLAGVLTMEQISDFLGIGEDGLRKKINNDLELTRLYKRGRARALRRVTGKLMKAIDKGHMASIFFYLKTQWGWRETERPGERDATASEKAAAIREALKLMDVADGLGVAMERITTNVGNSLLQMKKED